MGKRILFILIALSMSSVMTFGVMTKQFTLVVDAGHGGHDTGALGAFSKEKDINLNVALAFGKLVEKNCPDVKVIYTRKTDIFIPLQERADIANKAGADLLVSIHTNALPAGRIARGFETYTLGMHRAKDNLDVAMRENSVISLEKNYDEKYQGFDPRSSESYIMFEFMQSANMEKSVELAKMVQNNVCQSVGRNNMGIHQAGFLVLRQTSMPGCLIELGFITTYDEEEFLNTEVGIQSMSSAIYNGFAQYKNKFLKGTSSPKVNVVKPAFKEVKKSDESEKKNETKSPEKQNDTNSKAKTIENKAEKNANNRKTVAEKTSKSVSETTKPEVKKANVGKKVSENVKQQLVSEAAPKDEVTFRVQIFMTNKVISINDNRLKGHKDVSYYIDGGAYKYTIGDSSNYNDIVTLRSKLISDFPQAFVVAIKNGVRINLDKARKK